MGKELLLGITEKGVCHAKGEKEFDLETKFAMVRDSGVYDYFDNRPKRRNSSTTIYGSRKNTACRSAPAAGSIRWAGTKHCWRRIYGPAPGSAAGCTTPRY